MTTVQDVLDAAQRLSPVEQLEVIQKLSHALQQQYVGTDAVPSPALPLGRRILGLDKGKVWMSDDFDTELPDAFWLGDDDELVA